MLFTPTVGVVTQDWKNTATNTKSPWSKNQKAHELLPRTHRVITLLKRWLLGTHQGAVSHKHLAYYLDEFTFRFNRRTSSSRGKLFYRLVQQALMVEPRTYRMIVDQKVVPQRPETAKTQDVVVT